MNLSENTLIESPSARTDSIAELQTQHREQEVLNKVKALMFAVIEDTARISRDQVADFYEVPVSTIDSNYKRHRAEFNQDGVELFEGERLEFARGILPLANKSRKEVIYTPAGVLRMGFILRDSEVAREVRTMAIRIIQGVADLVDSKEAFLKLMDAHSGIEEFAEDDRPRISAPLYHMYDAVHRKLKRKYENGGIPGMDVEQIKELIAFLSTYTDDWKLQTAKEVKSAHSDTSYGYPHLTSDPFEVEINGQTKRALIMFQFFDPLVTDRDIADVDGSRRYIKSAKDTLGVDLAWLFFVAPFGATPKAVSYIDSELRDESKGFVGVLTVKEFADFLHSRACSTRSSNLIIGEINQRFREIKNYEIPDSPLDLLMEYQMPLSLESD